MLFGNKLLPAGRRFAAGIDVSQREVRLAVLSRHARLRGAPVRVEWLGVAPLAAGAMSGVNIVDRTAVAAAIGAVFAQWRERRSQRMLPCAMAVPGSATAIASVALARAQDAQGGALERLEPAVLAQAERVAGLERHAMALDWFVDDGGGAYGAPPDAGVPSGAARVTIAAAARQHVEARVEAAAAAGVVLSAVDGEPPAALRALCHAAELEFERGERYAAIWIGGDGIYGWRIGDKSVEARMRYPSPEFADLATALRGLAHGDQLDWALAGGEIGLLDSVGFTLADVGDLLGCMVLPFECAPFCQGASGCQAPPEWQHAPTFALAFGLALRGVSE
ncbi:MAG TPA: pilus assembly protein PilM [Trinickia sp.]|jgi:Tfp pilus assembly PilM family ATPase|nr:pilus assembly protein PilM [Trinickia sp.]